MKEKISFFYSLIFSVCIVNFIFSHGLIANNSLESHLSYYAEYEINTHDNILDEEHVHIHKHGPEDEEHHHKHEHQVVNPIDLKISNNFISYELSPSSSVSTSSFNLLGKKTSSVIISIFRPPIFS
jgi:hypothetical protein